MPHTLTVITEAHLLLAETDSVFALTDAIVLLQLGLVNALEELLVFCLQFFNCIERRDSGVQTWEGK
jgi:hypothetical protein